MQWYIISNKEPSCNQGDLVEETSIKNKIHKKLIEDNLDVWLVTHTKKNDLKNV